jgi:2'-5' RNA ligase
MAMIAIPISPDTSRLFKEIEIEGNREPCDHITMFYLGDNIPFKTILEIMPILYKVTSNTLPFEINCSKITTFPKGEYGYPIIAELKSKELMEIRKKILSSLRRNHIKIDNSFKEYRPHITLAFAKKRAKIKLPEKMTLMANQIALYGGDTADSKIFVNFPFTLNAGKIAKILGFSQIFEKVAYGK